LGSVFNTLDRKGFIRFVEIGFGRDFAFSFAFSIVVFFPAIIRKKSADVFGFSFSDAKTKRA
jgi:hypothetical protein